MIERIEKPVLVKCGVLFGLMVLVLALCKVFPNAATGRQTGMVLNPPPRVPGHVTVVVEAARDEKKMLPKDTGIEKRSYVPLEHVDFTTDPPSVTEEGMLKAIHATLILSGNDPRSLHKPEVCLDAQGWVISRKEVVELTVNGRPLEVMDFTMFRNERGKDGKTPVRRRAHYVYWWIGKERSTPHDWERILRSDLDNLLHNINNRWGYPSVLVYVDRDEPGGDQAASERAYDWIRDYAPLFQKSLMDEPIGAP